LAKIDPTKPVHESVVGAVDYSKDFFGKRVNLTVSGQLNVETHACALSDVYTFGPTFRAENSHTGRHLAEFWMIEPEICFADLADDINLAEDYLKYCVRFALENCTEDLEFFESCPHGEVGLKERLKNVLDNPFKVRRLRCRDVGENFELLFIEFRYFSFIFVMTKNTQWESLRYFP
jgi:asparaginyl-tRNA synthetase